MLTASWGRPRARNEYAVDSRDRHVESPLQPQRADRIQIPQMRPRTTRIRTITNTNPKRPLGP